MNRHFLLLLLYLSLITACSFAPKYHTPIVIGSKHYKEGGKWVKYQSNASLFNLKRPWWTLFEDDTLNALEQRVTCNNQNIKEAIAQYKEARAIAQVIYSKKYPQLTAIGTAARQENSPLHAATNLRNIVYNTFMLIGFVNYEVDLWGAVSNSVIAGDSFKFASAFNLAAIDLSMHAELASDYFQIRGIDQTQLFLDKIVSAYQKALYLKKQRYKFGVDPIDDTDQMIEQLENAKTIATELRLKRAELEHAIAVLVGDTPGVFAILPQRAHFKAVVAIPYLPSTLLRRRPDIAEAEEKVRAANASIGIAKAAFFPQVNMMGLFGSQSSQINKFLHSKSLFWAIGPPTTLALIEPQFQQTIFDGYKLYGQLKYAKAAYHETVSQYRQTALTAFKEVEDALVTQRRLAEENTSQSLATLAAKRALIQANHRMQGEIATYLDVVNTEVETLRDEIALTSIQARQQINEVQLIKALGGGWKKPCCRIRS